MKISFLVPVLNSEATLVDAVRGLREVCTPEEAEIIVVFDITKRELLPQIEALQADLASRFDARSLTRTTERGFGSALCAGTRAATGDVVVPIMADLCDGLSAVPAMRDKIVGGADVVAGARYIKGGRIIGDTPKQKLSRFYSKLIGALTAINCGDISNAFKMYRRDVWLAVDPQARSFDISAELTVKAAVLGYRIDEVPATWTNRQVGSSNFRVMRELNHYGRWFVIAVTCMPAAWVSVAGLGLPLLVRRIARRRLMSGRAASSEGRPGVMLVSDTAKGEAHES